MGTTEHCPHLPVAARQPGHTRTVLPARTVQPVVICATCSFSARPL